MNDQEIKIIIADDHYYVRAGLRHLLEKSPDMVVLGEARDGFETVELVEKYSPDVVLLDINMPGLDGIQALSFLTEKHPLLDIVIVTGEDFVDLIQPLILEGASGYFLKGDDPKKLIQIIREVVQRQRLTQQGSAARANEYLLDNN